MGDIGEFWRDVRDARRAAGLPARRSHKPPAERATKKEKAAFRAAGLEQKSEWHCQMRIGGELLDYWPSKAKYRFRGETAVASWKALSDRIAEIRS